MRRVCQDSRAEALAYLAALSNASMRTEMVEAFVDGVDPLLEWLAAKTPVDLRLVPRYPDYHPEHPGALPGGGRSLEPALTSTEPLGAWIDALVGDPRRMQVGEIPSGGGTGVLAPEVVAEREAGQLEGLGRGLVAALLRGCLESGVTVLTAARATGLLQEEHRVTGVRFEQSGSPEEVRARGGVVLATGGFEWDDDLVAAFLRGPIAHPPTAPSNTGDGLRMAMRAGAALASMQQAWWVPVVAPPGQQAPDGTPLSLLLLRERTLPGTIMVNREGRRFANEAANYNALGAAFHEFDVTGFRYANIPAWLVLDAACVERYGCFGVAPGSPAPEWLARADTLEQLAGIIDVPAPALRATSERWNRMVAEGRDADFHRGESIYDGWCGDQTHYATPQATLGEISTGPYYAVAVHGSTLGTKGGPRTTTHGEVLDTEGALVPGLYAAGNVMAAPTGMVYGGAGRTLGPALVFGHRAGLAAARRAEPG